MDYEKAYKAAKRLAAHWIEDGCEATERVLLETIFPELKESEDERIRKSLEDFLRDIANGTNRSMPCAEQCQAWLVYLEKQEGWKIKAWKPLEESMEALLLAIEGKWEAIKPTGYMSRRLEDLYDGLVNTFNIGETHLPKTNYTEEDIEELKNTESKIDASTSEKQDYSGLTDFERAIHRGFLCAGVENVPVEIIKETAQECLAYIEQKPVECIKFDNEFENQVSHLIASVLNGEHEYNEGFVKYAAQSLLGYANKEQIPYIDFVVKPHKGDDNNPYDMRVYKAQEYAINRGFSIPFNDGEVYVDERHMTQTIGNILRWADEHPKGQKPAEWSEEDDKMLERIIRHGDAEYKELCDDKFGNSEIVSDLKASCRERLRWLQSLRDNPKKANSWKPSVKQMVSLKEAIIKARAYNYGVYLQDLFFDLQKLR